MTSDVSIIYQPPGTYRYLKNCQLISQDGNNFVIKDCLGNVLFLEINIPYATSAPTYQANPMIIGFISFTNRLIVLSTNSETETGGYGEIGEILYNNYGEGIQVPNTTGADNQGYRVLYHHASLNFTKLRRVEGFAYEENDGIQRIYWTDNLNEPRVFNVADPIFTTYIASGSIADGTQYMVLEGIVTYNAVNYGPGLAAGNIFTGTATTTYTDVLGPNPTAKVIRYYPYQLLNFTPSRSMGTIKFKNYGTGTVYCGAKMYFYRLSNPATGITTSWSYGSAPIHVGTDNTITAVPANPFFDFTGGGSTNTLENSEHSVFITIDNIDTNFTNIEVAVAEFDQSLDVIRVINIIANSLITATSMDFEHTGSTNLGELTTGDITLFPASILKCKTLTTNKNYILIGNTTEREEFSDFSRTGVTFSQIQHKMRAHQAEYGAASTAQVCENILSYNIFAGASNVTPDAGGLAADNPPLVNGIQPYTEWFVSAGTATYDGVAYGPAEAAGQFFRGVLTVYNWANTSGTAVVSPAVYRNKYTTTGGVKRPDGIQFNTNDSDQWTYRNPAVAAWKKGYWSAETYRFGILFYDLKGNPFGVRWLGDFTFNTVDNVPLSELVQVNSGGDDDWYLNQNGISISGITIPATIIDKISGFSIVRAERDAKIFTQGLLMQTMATAATGGFIYPLPSPYINAVTYAAYNFARDTVFSYICPDELVAFPNENYGTNGNLKTSHWLNARQVLGFSMKSSSDGDEATETKYFEQAAAETTGPPSRTYKISALQDVSEDQAITNFGVLNSTFWNRTAFTNTAPCLVTDGSCIVPFSTPNLRNCQAIGGKRTVVELNGSQVFDYNSTTVAYANLGTAGDRKMMCNVFVDKSNLYGGQSETALANTFYISTGHFQPITAAVKTDTLSAGNYVFNNVEIWGGDCYNCLVTYGHSLYDLTLPPGVNYSSYSWGIKFACQCNSNYDLRSGRLVEAVRMTALGTIGGSTVSYNPVRLEGFSYNKGYSSQGIAFLYPALPVNYIGSGQYKFRVRYSEEKIPGEVNDSFRTFAILDFKDMSAQSGEVNNLSTITDRTFVWQNAAVSSVPILERQVVTPNTGDDVAIGTGGVVDRFDVISSYYGNQHQWGLTKTEYGFAWFDMRRKGVVVLDISGGVAEMSFIDGLKGFFDEIFIEVPGVNTTTSATDYVLNSQTYDKTSDRPLFGVGITGAYEPKFKTTYLTFKFYTRNPTTGTTNNLNKDFTVLYYHSSKAFIGFNDWVPAIAHTHNQSLFSVNNPKNVTKFYGTGMGSTTFEIGDTVSYNNVEYICIFGVTITSYPGTAPQIPDAVGSIYWVKINKTNELWVHNSPSDLVSTPAPDYLYNKFFGKVVNNEAWIVVNPKTQNAFNVLNMEQHGNNVNVTDVYTSADSQTAQDTSISAVSRYYKVIYDAVCSSLPLTSTGTRITARYLLVKLVKKNWTTVPYTLTGSVKILQFLKSIFQEKR